MPDKNIAIDGEVYDYIADQAKRNHRTIKGQIAYMIDLIRVDHTKHGQVHMPTTPEEKAQTFGRVSE